MRTLPKVRSWKSEIKVEFLNVRISGHNGIILRKQACQIYVHVNGVFVDLSTNIAMYNAEMNKQLSAAMSTLKEKQDALQQVLDHVANLERTLNETVAEKDRLVNEAAVTEARLKRANILTGGLSELGVRWQNTVAKIGVDIENLTGDVFLSAASISYYGPFAGVTRNDIVEEWLQSCKERETPCGDSFDLRKVMGNPVEVREWNLQGKRSGKHLVPSRDQQWIQNVFSKRKKPIVKAERERGC